MGILSNGEYLMRWPLSEHVITAGYYYSDGSLHRAIDLRTNYGGTTLHDVACALRGTVKEVHKWDGNTKTGTESYGNYVVVEHTEYSGKSLRTRYAHLSSVCVMVGQQVEEGETIGVSGSTGNVTGPHLHFEVILNGTRVNPLVWLDSDFEKAYSYVYTYRPGETAVVIPEGEATVLSEVKIECSSEEAYNKVVEMAKDMSLPFYFKVSSGDLAKIKSASANGLTVTEGD